MEVLQILSTIYTNLDDSGAIVRIDMDQEAHGEQCKIAVISQGVYAAGIVDATDWADPAKLADDVMNYWRSALPST